MNSKNVLLPALAAILSTFLISAPTSAQDGEALDARVKDAAAGKTDLGMPLMFRVDGLTKENVDVVQRNLMSLTETVYVCASCEHVATKAGKCIPCNIDLKAKQMAILSEAKPTLEDGRIRLTPFAARTLRYSVLRSTLLKDTIEVDDAKFPLAGEARLVLRGGTLESVKTIEKALKDSKLFASAKGSFVDESSEIHVVIRPKATPCTYDAVAAVIDELGTKVTFADVVWGPPQIPAKL